MAQNIGGGVDNLHVVAEQELHDCGQVVGFGEHADAGGVGGWVVGNGERWVSILKMKYTIYYIMCSI